ncbi:RNA-binding ATPase activator esf2 [Chytridiales sp. JEL 0842]|nr:RNA-binding ATPase activator esf2 [Chytridiales sp. JEL 0842]
MGNWKKKSKRSQEEEDEQAFLAAVRKTAMPPFTSSQDGSSSNTNDDGNNKPAEKEHKKDEPGHDLYNLSEDGDRASEGLDDDNDERPKHQRSKKASKKKSAWMDSDEEEDKDDHAAKDVSEEESLAPTRTVKAAKVAKGEHGKKNVKEVQQKGTNNKLATTKKSTKATTKTNTTTDPRFAAMNDKNWGKAFAGLGDDDDDGSDENAETDEHAQSGEEDGIDDYSKEDNDHSDEEDDKDEDEDYSNLLPSELPDILNVDNPKPTNDTSTSSSSTSKPLKPISASTLTNFNDTLNRTGVIYISRPPPFLKPQKLRQLLAPYGPIGRIYMNPEDPKITARRKKYRGNKRQNYTEAWVEFENKKQARRTAELLHLRSVDPRKGSRYHDDLWNIKYLPRFKWHHLTDQVAYERAVRQQRLRVEMEGVKRENKMYLKNVEKSKMIEAMEAKKRKREEEAGEKGEAMDAAAKKAKADKNRVEVSRQFRQRAIKDASASSSASAAAPSAKKSSVLSKIFG